MYLAARGTIRCRPTFFARLCSTTAQGPEPDIGKPLPAMPVSFGDISTASFHIRDEIPITPCERAQMGMVESTCVHDAGEIFFKKDFMLPTGSFKERGARNALKKLSKEQKKVGAIAASAGNHALAMAWHGRSLGIPVTVVTPVNAPIMKVAKCRALGARVVSAGEHILESFEAAQEMVRTEGLEYINGFDHPNIIAGAGTMGLEILNQVENVDAVVVPVGGGGLIAGLALAMKTLKPDILVIGAEAAKCASFSEARRKGTPVHTTVMPTLADGLAVPKVGTNAFAVANPLVDRVVTVQEKYIALALLKLLEVEKAVVEGGGATGLAACITPSLLPELEGKRVVIPLCGGNIDSTVLGRIIERGLAADGRLFKFVATVSDRPGGLASLTKLLADHGASIKDSMHERAWLSEDIFAVKVQCVIEVRDAEHGQQVRDALTSRYPIEWGGRT